MTHLVGVYGTLKKGFNNHQYLKKAKFIYPDFINGILGYYLIPKSKESPYEVKLPTFVNVGNNSVFVEVYEVDDKTLDKLDKLETHPDVYKRTKMTTASGLDIYVYIWKHEMIPTDLSTWEDK